MTTISLYDYYGKLRQQKLEIDSELKDYYSDFTRQCKSTPSHPPKPRIQFVSVENGRTDIVHAGLNSSFYLVLIASLSVFNKAILSNRIMNIVLDLQVFCNCVTIVTACFSP